jgi:tRNA A-37 threonylcarbamoyl transferase component Bud32
VADQFNLQPGTIFAGDFRLVRAMSAGGMGAVYVAEQLSTGKQRALKVMLPQLVADPSLRKRFEQEARIASLIESEHVVEVVGAGVDAASSLPYLAMELLHGEDLSQLVTRGGPLSVADVAMIFEQLCHAVGAAHRVGVVHRDLKPENIFLAQARRAGATYMVKVLDFGIAKIVAEATTKQTAAMGSPIWMAPEQADQSPVTAATDVWALGLIAFYLLSGRSFWKTGNDDYATVPQVLKEVLFEPIVPASVRAAETGCSLPPGFDGWFARCVARDPATRFVDASLASATLLPMLQGSVAFDATYLPVRLPSAPPASAYPSVHATGPAAASGTGPAAYTMAEPAPAHPITQPPRGGRVPVAVAVLILIAVTALGSLAAGALWWATRRPTTTAATVAATVPPSLDAGASPDAERTDDGAVDALPPADASLAKVVSVAAHSPVTTHPHAQTLPGAPDNPQPAPPAPLPQALPPPQRSIADLASSAVSADWWVARRALEPKLYNGTATVEDVRLLLKICKNQRDGACQKACKRVLSGKKP